MAASHSDFGKAEPYASTRGGGAAPYEDDDSCLRCLPNPPAAPLGAVLSTTCVVSAIATASSPVQQRSQRDSALSLDFGSVKYVSSALPEYELIYRSASEDATA
ncbi:hypothetical protein CUR178_02697 [Leishmania enriettii]|uniref:Uncharacterized protein n=1 Tax=Leishmania enriettii TaxID=5663 RepID=A0A836H6T9_LEIEN|nr:hypothetical protein CUR178_02697 [Leishmania enriettii]